jgi:thiamine-phosphate pyrophosphorylase
VGWVVEEAVQGGVTMVQLREKHLSTRAFVERAKRLKDILGPYHVPLIINDRIDVALAIDADGVHIGQSDMPYEMVNQLLPENKIIGLSVEKREDVLAAEELDVTYLGVSPVFSTHTKTDTLTPWELEGLKWVSENSRHSLIAIGGLSLSNAWEVVRHGASGIAVVSAICGAPSPYEAAFRLKSMIQSASVTNPES